MTDDLNLEDIKDADEQPPAPAGGKVPDDSDALPDPDLPENDPVIEGDTKPGETDA